ncbi:hypothetical protein ABEX08_29620 [Priestia megaterium]
MSSSSINYANQYGNQKEDGWYLLVFDDTKTVLSNFNYKKIKRNVLENITTTALNDLKKDGFIYNANVNNLVKYEIALLHYSNNKVIGRYMMKYKQTVSFIDGYYNGWKFETTDEDGKFIPYDKDYKWWRAYWLPITVSLLQLLIISCIEFFPNDIASFIQRNIFGDNDKGNFAIYYRLTNGILAFLVFNIGLMHSSFSVLAKDLIKLHYLKDNLKRIKRSTIVFEIPVFIAAIYTVYKMSNLEGNINWTLFILFASVSLYLIIWKIASTYGLEYEKKHK